MPYDVTWPLSAAERLADLRRALQPLDPDEQFDYQHIGSTSVPGLAAKPFLDLQIRVPRLPDPVTLDAAVMQARFQPEPGARPDSPGVHRDSPRGSATVSDIVWEKRLFTATQPDAVLHVRRIDSPWGHYTLQFRDWLRAHPDEAAAYERTKLALARRHSADPDYDDYTRAKTAYFDRVQPRFEDPV